MALGILVQENGSKMTHVTVAVHNRNGSPSHAGLLDSSPSLESPTPRSSSLPGRRDREVGAKLSGRGGLSKRPVLLACPASKPAPLCSGSSPPLPPPLPHGPSLRCIARVGVGLLVQVCLNPFTSHPSTLTPTLPRCLPCCPALPAPVQLTGHAQQKGQEVKASTQSTMESAQGKASEAQQRAGARTCVCVRMRACVCVCACGGGCGVCKGGCMPVCLWQGRGGVGGQGGVHLARRRAPVCCPSLAALTGTSLQTLLCCCCHRCCYRHCCRRGHGRGQGEPVAEGHRGQGGRHQVRATK